MDHLAVEAAVAVVQQTVEAEHGLMVPVVVDLQVLQVVAMMACMNVCE